MSATVSRVADKWFVSITVDTEEPPKRRAENQGVVGVDLGISALATLSTGEKAVGPKPHRALLKRQKRLSRSLSRKHLAAKAKAGLSPRQAIPKGVRLPVSENAKKARARLSRLHARIAHIRQDALHQLTSGLILNRIGNRVNYVLPSGDGFHPRMVRLKGTKAGASWSSSAPRLSKARL